MRAAPSPALAALLAAAASLTGTAQAADDETAAGHRLSYRYTLYDEDALPATPVDGSTERYRVYANQLRVDAKPFERWGLAVTATQEIMSGSSPWFTLPGVDGPRQVMSGATIHDKRREVAATFTRDPETSHRDGISLSYSSENDYHAAALGYERSRALSAATTLGFGASVSHDTIEPVDAEIYDRIHRATKNSVSAFASLAWVLDRDSVLQAGLQLTRHQGYLSDPYKRVATGAGLVRDARPDERLQSAWLLRYRHAYPTLDAALHLDYRFAWDSWGLHSHTVEAAWYQALPDGWRLVPALRYYSQSHARFYLPFTDADPRYASSDFRLSSYGALSGGLSVRKRLGQWELSLGVDRYHSAGKYGLDGSDDDPGLVSFTRVFAGFDYLFD